MAYLVDLHSIGVVILEIHHLAIVINARNLGVRNAVLDGQWNRERLITIAIEGPSNLNVVLTRILGTVARRERSQRTRGTTLKVDLGVVVTTRGGRGLLGRECHHREAVNLKGSLLNAGGLTNALLLGVLNRNIGSRDVRSGGRGLHSRAHIVGQRQMLDLDRLGFARTNLIGELVLLELNGDGDAARNRLRFDHLIGNHVARLVGLGHHERDIVQQGIVVGVFLTLRSVLVEGVHVSIVVVVGALLGNRSHHELGASGDRRRVRERGCHGHGAVVVDEGRLGIGLGLGGLFRIGDRLIGGLLVGVSHICGGLLGERLVLLILRSLLISSIASGSLIGLARRGLVRHLFGLGLGLGGVLSIALGDGLVHGRLLLLDGALGSNRRLVCTRRHGRRAHHHGHREDRRDYPVGQHASREPVLMPRPSVRFDA